MTVAVDEDAVREFIGIIVAHAVKLAKGLPNPGMLQLSRLNCVDEKFVPTRFRLDDVEGMVKAAIADANAGHNVYIEPRTVRSDLRGNTRGGIDDTVFVFGLVVDSDHDKGKGVAITVRPSLVVETSPGNFHYWYLFDRPVSARQAKSIGEAIRASTGADANTGVVTQPYRVAGTPNFPSKAKQARGRTAVEPTRPVERTARLWDLGELLTAYGRTPAPAAPTPAPAPNPTPDEASLPEGLMKAIREGGASKGLGAKGDKSGSGLFHHIVGELKKRKWTVEAIAALLEKYPNGAAAKYNGRILEEARRSYDKVENGNGRFVPPGGGVGGGPPPPPGPTPGSAGGAGAGPPHTLSTIQIRDGQMIRAVEETERAMLAAGIEVFARAGMLAYPVVETLGASVGRKVDVVQLRTFTPDSFFGAVAEGAIFQRYDMKRRMIVDVDPPMQLVRFVLSHERRWAFPRVSGVITTPTLRADGSLLSTPGHDPRTELYLRTDLQLPPIPQRPTQEEAREALAVLKEPFAEFSFQRKALDLSVSLSALMTALLRGSLPTSPVYLVRADTPGVGKSYLIDTVSMIATGGLCPVVTASRNAEETEKRLGAILLSGSPIVSLDNMTRDLEGELLCQIAERPMVRIRVLGKSEMPLCEVHTAIFSTGNNVGYAGDMVRRGLTINLEALTERPETREFKRNVVEELRANRARYVAAALTIARAYIEAGAPRACGPLGSYAAWSVMARAPLIWLGEPDPILCMEETREEDPELGHIREFFILWPSYMRMDTPYTAARITEIACEDTSSNRFSPDLKAFLLKVASIRGRESEISLERLGWWLRRISGRIVGGLRLVKGKDTHMKIANYGLTKL
jgi:putative DNA primase/helicase